MRRAGGTGPSTTVLIEREVDLERRGAASDFTRGALEGSGLVFGSALRLTGLGAAEAASSTTDADAELTRVPKAAEEGVLEGGVDLGADEGPARGPAKVLGTRRRPAGAAGSGSPGARRSRRRYSNSSGSWG